MTPRRSAQPFESAEDAKLVARVSAGDDTALASLYQRHGRAAYGLALRIVRDPQFAQDVVQEAFLVVWRDAARFDASRGSFAPWLLAMVHHKSVDTVRREENLRQRRASADLLLEMESDAPRVDEQAWTTFRRERVRSALLILPPAQREALVLAYFGGFTQREIAQLTATPLGTVKTRMLAGMRRLRGVLDGLTDGPFVGGGGGSP